MSQIVKTAETALETARPATFKLADRIILPASVTREEAKELSRALWASDASAFAGVSAVASNDNLASKVVSLALSKLVFGEHSRLDRIERYAATLPEYKKSKAGEITGAIGKRISLFREAVTIGAAIRSTITNIDITSTFNLEELFGASPVLGGMLLPPPPKKIAREDPTVTTARVESLAKAEAERRAAETCEAEQASIVKLTMQEVQTGILSMGSSLDNEAAPQQYQIMRLETARALRIAEESARENAEQEYKYQQKGKTLVAKIHGFCSLATELGIKLTPAQLKILDALEYPIKAA